MSPVKPGFCDSGSLLVSRPHPWDRPWTPEHKEVGGLEESPQGQKLRKPHLRRLG